MKKRFVESLKHKIVYAIGFIGTLVVLTAASTAWDTFIAIPRGTGSGLTGLVRFRELAANGTHSVDWKSPDSLASTTTYTWPAALPGGPSYSLVSSITGATSWQNITSGAGGGGSCGEPFCLATVPTTGWTSENFGAGTSLVNNTTLNYDLIRETADSTNIRARYRTAPGAPFTCAADFVYVGGRNTEVWFGIGQRQSSDGKWAILLLRSTGIVGNYRASAAASPGFTAIGSESSVAIPSWGGKVVRLATRDDGTNRQFGYIDSEFNFALAEAGGATEGRTNGMTADQVGWFMWKNADVEASVSLIGWECR